MKKQKQFCCFCGSTISQKEIEDKIRGFCTSCGTVFYENPLPVASSIVVNEKREILLVQRKKDPYKNMWCLPIGFAEAGEEVKDAALRELKEEAGVDGEIIQLIDVDTVENYFYGSLAIVTYEVKMICGEVCPGDDAVDAKFFPIFDIPELAWTSNEKAVRIYIDQHRDVWAMIDSFQQLLPEIDPIHFIDNGQHPDFLSNILIKLIDKEREIITRNWIDDVFKNIPKLITFFDKLFQINQTVLDAVISNIKLSDSGKNFEIFYTLGLESANSGIPLPEFLTALALSRKQIWIHVINSKIISSPLEIYSTLELNNRIIFIYDRINFMFSKGYFK
jgi:ADP-ribose pyrophosphatase YjhB (NUDIX family)